MDREFTWNRVEPNEKLVYSQSRQAEIDDIKSRILSLKLEREQLVAQLGDEYSDERLGAQMLRAGDEGAMYKFLRGQQDQMKLNAADNANKNTPTQADVDKLLETLYATEASIGPETKGEQLTKANRLTNLYRAQLNAIAESNPGLDFRGYLGDTNKAAGGTNGSVEVAKANRSETPPAGTSGWGQPGDLNYFNYRMVTDAANMSDEEIDKLKKSAIDANPDYANEFEESAKKAKAANLSRYNEYKEEIDRKNALLTAIFNERREVNDQKTKDTLAKLIKLIGGGIDSKGNLRKIKAKGKDEFLKKGK